MISQGEKKGPVSSADVQKIQTESVSRHDWFVTMIANNIVVPTVISSSCRFKYKSVKTVKSSNLGSTQAEAWEELNREIAERRAAGCLQLSRSLSAATWPPLRSSSLPVPAFRSPSRSFTDVQALCSLLLTFHTMGWFSNLFSPAASNVNARKKMAMSTHDAFSLPTSSPITASHPDAFARSGANTPEIESQLNPSYSYPPPMNSPTTYDYVPRVKYVHLFTFSLLCEQHSSPFCIVVELLLQTQDNRRYFLRIPPHPYRPCHLILH